jgi:hypothetical protein
MKNLILVFSCLFALNSCVFDRGCNISILNKSDHTIYVYKSFSDSLKMSGGLAYKLEQQNYKGDDTLIYPSYRAEPNSYAYVTFVGKYEYIFNNKECKDGKLRLFFIHEDTILRYTWEEICRKQLYEKKLILNEAELRRGNWEVIYRNQ